MRRVERYGVKRGHEYGMKRDERSRGDESRGRDGTG